jgi:endonuclease III
MWVLNLVCTATAYTDTQMCVCTHIQRVCTRSPIYTNIGRGHNTTPYHTPE